MRLIRIIAVCSLVAISIPLIGDAFAQRPQAEAQSARPLQRPSTAQLHEDMQRLNWMIGKWEGSGWAESATLGRTEFSYSLNVRPEFGGSLLIVDGVGYVTASGSVAYAEQLLISGPFPTGTYLWQESGRGVFLRGNDAWRTGRSLSFGLPLDLEDCDRIVDESYRTFCRTGGERLWSQATISLNDEDEWVQTREWQDNEANRKWHTYFKVVLKRVSPEVQ